MIGELTPQDIGELRFQQLISNSPWIVKNGQNQETSGGEIAPRTTIGYNKKGELLIVEVDGAEAQRIGLTLYETAELMISLGAQQVLNLDGGGSSVVYYKGHVISQPTCTDTIYEICERAVTTIACVK